MRNFHILIVSAVKICKQCLQTVSASGDSLPGLLPGLYPWTTLGLLSSDPLGYSPQKKIPATSLLLPPWKYLI